MEQILTLVVKLQPTSEQRQLLNETATAFADACNWINQNVKTNLTNRNSIQAVCYQEVKERFGLTANHVVRACARVAANRLTAKHKGKKVKGFVATSFDCDSRTFRVVEKDYLVSISTTGKRVKVPMRVSNYHLGKLSGQNPTSAQVCLHKDKDWYASLQRKATQGTRSTRRRCRQILKRLSGRERRFQTWLNHNISKAIVSEAKQSQSFIAIEDLTGIRERTNQKPRNKTERRRSNSWAFYQLRTFLEYKGIKEGVEVTAINPAYTSQTCHCCLHIGLRSNKVFKCSNQKCGWIGDADLNGSLMIALVGLSVSQPRGSNLLACPVDLGLRQDQLIECVGESPRTLVGG